MRDRTFPRHVHVWLELLPRGDGARTTFVVCDLCEKIGHDTVKYLDSRATAEFRRQIKHGIKPRFVRDGLVPVEWSKRK